MKIFGILLAVMLAQLGAAPDTPVRHLEYAFASYPTAVPNGGYYNGTLRVDILGPAPDGGTLVRTSEWWYYELRPRQAAECELYPNGSVNCDTVPPYPSQSALVLLPLLARDFFSSASPGSSWQQKYALTFQKQLFTTAASMKLAATPQSNGHLLNVTSEGTLQQLDRRMQYSTEKGQYVYDRATSLPLIVHDVRANLPTRSVYTQMSVDLQITKDSAEPNATAFESIGPTRFQINAASGAAFPNLPAPAAPALNDEKATSANSDRTPPPRIERGRTEARR